MIRARVITLSRDVIGTRVKELITEQRWPAAQTSLMAPPSLTVGIMGRDMELHFDHCRIKESKLSLLAYTVLGVDSVHSRQIIGRYLELLHRLLLREWKHITPLSQ